MIEGQNNSNNIEGQLGRRIAEEKDRQIEGYQYENISMQMKLFEVKLNDAEPSTLILQYSNTLQDMSMQMLRLKIARYLTK